MRISRFFALAIGFVCYAGATTFPSGLIPFTQIYYVTPADSNGDRLVVGKANLSAFQAILAVATPAYPNEVFSDASIELAPGQFFHNVYVPTAAERSGDFSSFGRPLTDPLTGYPFVGNYIPTSRLPDPFAFRVGPGLSVAPSRFVPVTPCRIADTRNASGPFGGPSLAAGSTRIFSVPSSTCGIPAGAQAYALNVTVVPKGPLRWITVWPTGQSQPVASTLNAYDGRVKANAAIVPAGSGGSIAVFATDQTDLVLDISGYFTGTTNTSALAFYPMTPCRVADTRDAAGPLGGPSLANNETRGFPVLSSTCGIPAAAQAYSLNVTAVPKGPLPWLTVWPAGQPYPGVSALNAPTGTAVANGAIVPAGSNGDVSVFAASNTDVILDINGYFAPAATGGLSLYNLTPCRVLDTREGSGGATSWDDAGEHGECPLRCSSGAAYVVNATVIPLTKLDWLTLWPFGSSQPAVSTLNAYDGWVASNLAIVPAANGSVDAFATDPSHLILDVAGYFAP